MFDDQSVLKTEAGEAAIEDGPREDGALLEQQLADARAQADENYNKFLLATADFENFKKRLQRDREASATSYRRALIESFLPVFDNLQRALEAEGSDQSLRGGVEQTLKGFEAILAGQGVRELAVKDEPFDPRFAEAVATVERNDVAEDTVVNVVQKGYGIGDELIRPAKVIVSKNAG